MNEIEDLYLKNNKFLIGNNIPWLTELRKNLLNEISIKGIPNKKKEIWKYSNLAHINNIKYYTVDSVDNKKNLYKNEKQNCIDAINGKYFFSDDIKNNKNISLSHLSESINNFKNYFYFNNNLFNNDFTVDINTIFLSDGISFSVNDNNNFKLTINYKNISNDVTSYLRNIIKVGNNSKLTLVEDFTKSESKNNSINVFNNFWLERGSEVEHIIIQDSQHTSEVTYSSLVYCYEDAKFNQLSFQIGSSSAKNQHTTNLMGENSFANHYGIYFGENKQFIDNKTLVKHHKENCQSNQIYKGILKDDSNGVYLSNTLVNPDAQKTKGYQLSRGILLSENCKLNTKPELKIYADDVKCSHGSTVGALDKNQLFYLQSRGLSKKVAENFLIRAFYKDVLPIINDKESIIRIDELVNKWLSN